MPPITPIRLSLPLGLGSVNCYLINTGGGFVLVDTGVSARRAELEAALDAAGVTPGEIRLIVITHGDFDHTANAAFLRRKHGAKIAMHPADAPMSEQGDMFAGRTGKPNAVIRAVSPLIMRFAKEDRFSPDIRLEDGASLAAYGLEAEVLNIPGHSKGSIALLLPDGTLFSGDLLDNTKGPGFTSLMDDRAAAEASLARLAARHIGIVYPGHGEPFHMAQLMQALAPEAG